MRARGDPAGARRDRRDPRRWPAPPARVVSINLCTDQLAMLIAAPASWSSVSSVARDPVSSALAAEAAAYPVNHGSAEEIFLLDPDLVLAGEYDRPATRAALDRLGLTVETFPIETGFADIRANVDPHGRAARPRGARGRAASPRWTPRSPRRRAAARRRARALFYANAYTSGAGTLADEILTAAGFRNIAAERGVTGLARLPLEVLVLEAPDLRRHRPGLREPGARAGRAAPPGRPRARRRPRRGRRQPLGLRHAARRARGRRRCARSAMTEAARYRRTLAGPRPRRRRCCSLASLLIGPAGLAPGASLDALLTGRGEADHPDHARDPPAPRAARRC